MAGTVETLLLVALSLLATEVKGHGRLMEPPARNVMWRFGYKTHVNYEDNMLHCGGFNVSTCLKKLRSQCDLARKRVMVGETGTSSASGHVRHMVIFSMQIKIWSWITLLVTSLFA